MWRLLYEVYDLKNISVKTLNNRNNEIFIELKSRAVTHTLLKKYLEIKHSNINRVMLLKINSKRSEEIK